MKILKEIHTNSEGWNEMWFELSKGYPIKISHKDMGRDDLIKRVKIVYKTIYEDIKDE